MREIARKDFGFIFYEISDNYLLSTLCGTVGLFTVDFFLNKEERQNYKNKGLSYIDELAGNVVRFYDSYWHRCIITNVEYIIFGHFNSESNESYTLYRLDNKSIAFDSSERWHNERFSENGYIFNGQILNQNIFEIHKNVIYSIPKEIYKGTLKSHNTPDNYRENKLIIEYKCYGTTYKYTIDLFDEINLQKLTNSVKLFRQKIENIINEINTERGKR